MVASACVVEKMAARMAAGLRPCDLVHGEAGVGRNP